MTRSQGPLLRRRYPASTLIRPCPSPAQPAGLTGVGGATSDRDGLPPITRSTLTSVPCPLPRRIETGACVDCFPISRGLPRFSAGRHPHHHFRGLLRLHSRYGPLARSTAQGGLCRKAPARQVARTDRLPATRSIDNSLGGSYLHWCYAPSGRTEKAGLESFRFSWNHSRSS